MIEIDLTCMICHRNNKINTSSPKTYDAAIIRDNHVCFPCQNTITRIKITLTCSKCNIEFYTKILMINKEKYNNGWKCPICSSNGGTKNNVKKDVGVPTDCVWCKHKRGVCTQPNVPCKLAHEFIPFNNAESLYSLKKECTILSVDQVDKSRSDIHAFKYALLYKASYLMSPKNIILIKQRIGSKKNFKTNILLYSYELKSSKFEVIYNNIYDRGINWVEPTRDFVISKRPDLIKNDLGGLI